MAKFLTTPAQDSVTLWASDSCVFPIFSYFLYWSLYCSIVPCFIIVHCICDSREGRKLVFYLVVTRIQETPFNPVELIVHHAELMD